MSDGQQVVEEGAGKAEVEKTPSSAGMLTAEAGDYRPRRVSSA